MTEAPSTERLPSAGVLRRLGAMLYDLFLLMAVMMVVTSVLLPLTGGEAITSERYGAWEYAYQALLVAIVVGFFGLFWTRRGQTLGMLAWRLRIQREDGGPLRWSDVLKRLAVAGGLLWPAIILATSMPAVALATLLPALSGYAWIWIDRDGLAWWDRWTRTHVVVLPKSLR